MKRILRSTLFSASLLASVSAASWAVCGGGVDCERPDFNAGTSAGWTVTASGITGIKSLNSVGPTGNPINSKYWIAATTTDHGASSANGTITSSGDGTTQLGNTFATNPGSTPGSNVTGMSVQGV